VPLSTGVGGWRRGLRGIDPKATWLPLAVERVAGKWRSLVRGRAGLMGSEVAAIGVVENAGL